MTKGVRTDGELSPPVTGRKRLFVISVGHRPGRLLAVAGD